MLGSVLLLDIGVHRIVDRCGRHHGVIGDESDLDDMGHVDGGGMQRVLHGEQCPVSCMVRFGAVDRIRGRRVGFHPQKPLHGRHNPFERTGPAQCDIEFGVVEKIASLRHLLGDMQALQDFRLAGHHRFGGGVRAQDALQFPHLVLAGLVDQRTGGGVERSYPLQHDEGAERQEHDDRDQHVCTRWRKPIRNPARLSRDETLWLIG